MSTRAGLIAAILDNLADDTPRLIFADFLQENGEAERAEFIRLDIEAARLPRSGKQKKKAANLLEKHGAAWRGRVSLGEHERTFERGFFANVGLYSKDFNHWAARILMVEPAAFTLVLYPHGTAPDRAVTLAEVGELADDPHLKAVTRIVSQNGRWGPKRFARLMQSPHLGNLKKLELFEDVVGLAGMRAIVESPSPFILEMLDLNESLQDPDITEKPGTVKAVKLIASSPRFASLKHLGLMFNSLEEKSAKALIASKTLPRTLYLDINENPCEDEDWRRFADRFTGIPPADDED